MVRDHTILLGRGRGLTGIQKNQENLRRKGKQKNGLSHTAANVLKKTLLKKYYVFSCMDCII